MKRDERIRDFIDKLDKMGDELLAIADDLDKARLSAAENEVRNAVASLETAGVNLYKKLK